MFLFSAVVFVIYDVTDYLTPALSPPRPKDTGRHVGRSETSADKPYSFFS
jgi:hypothetical protein